MTRVGIGLDLVETAEVKAAISRHGERYLRRTYTARELEDCRGDSVQLAMRFAAKEAALKALGAGQEGMPWTDVEVRRSREGWSVALTGTAAKLAGGARLASTALSSSGASERVGAIVVAYRDASSVEAGSLRAATT